MPEPSEAYSKTLFYFADPMCSWCWGFSPVMESVVRRFPQLPVSLVMGGLRAGSTGPLAAGQRDEILHHWQEVQRRTGQPFRFEGALPSGFVYDTEPACRAVVSMIALNRPAALAYFRSLQRAFYAEQLDVTHVDVLALRAAEFGVNDESFRVHFASAEAQGKTRRHFAFARDSGVRGFPTIVLGDERGTHTLTQGYRPFDELQPEIERWLDASAGTTH